MSAEPTHFSPLSHQSSLPSDGTAQRSSAFSRPEEQAPLSGIETNSKAELSLLELRQWLLDMEAPAGGMRLADLLVRPFDEILVSAQRCYSSSGIAFRPNLDAIRFPAAHLSHLRQALCDGLVDCFILEAYPDPEWFRAQQSARALSQIEFALVCATGNRMAGEARFASFAVDDEDFDTLRMGRVAGCLDHASEITWQACCESFSRLQSTLPRNENAASLAGTTRIVFTATRTLRCEDALSPLPRSIEARVAQGSFAHFLLTSPFQTLTPVEWLGVRRLCSEFGLEGCTGAELTAGITRSGVVHASNEFDRFRLYSSTIETPAFRFRVAI